MLIILFSLPAQAQRSIVAENECVNLNSHADMRFCLEKRATENQRELARVEKRLLVSIEKWDEDDTFNRRSIAQFKKSSIQFKKYRAAQCNFQASLTAGGNGAGDRKLLCVIELNTRHVNDLRTLEGQIN